MRGEILNLALSRVKNYTRFAEWTQQQVHDLVAEVMRDIDDLEKRYSYIATT